MSTKILLAVKSKPPPYLIALVKSICRRTFIDYVNDSKIEVQSGGMAKLYMKESPLLALGGLEYSSDYGATYTTLTEFTDFVTDLEDNSLVVIGASPDTVFTRAINGYKLTYTAGYETLPADLKVAVLDLLTYYLKNDMAVHSNKAQGTNTVQIEYVTTTALPSHIKRVLDLYTESYS